MNDHATGRSGPPTGLRVIDCSWGTAGLRATGRVAACAGPDGRTVRELALLVRVSDSSTVAHRLAPGRGEHTSQLLTWAGYDAEEIAELKSRHVIG